MKLTKTEDKITIELSLKEGSDLWRAIDWLAYCNEVDALDHATDYYWDSEKGDFMEDDAVEFQWEQGPMTEEWQEKWDEHQDEAGECSMRGMEVLEAIGKKLK